MTMSEEHIAPEDDFSSHLSKSRPQTSTYLLAGAVAGFAVDVVLFPLDTIKTRMQSANGFWRSGGFTNIYAGIGSAAVGSAPGAALFFATYEYLKHHLVPLFPSSFPTPLLHCTAAAGGELIACLVRVPTENIKQKLQSTSSARTLSTIRNIWNQQGLRGFYIGYGTTIMREIPFSFIQFPLYEYSKKIWSLRNGRDCTNAECAIFGSITGSIAAAATTPMDVIKTRLMTQSPISSDPLLSMSETVNIVLKERGIKGFFVGVGPRVAWIGLGGGVFFGAYEATKKAIHSFQHKDTIEKKRISTLEFR